jgi:hypothetical protein
VLGDDGVSTPGIYGVRLDGRDGTSVVRDTDHGRLDRDAEFDRAVGPMQFVPGTWDVVGVDGDNDGARNPQDIDDAAVAAGVYLCAGDHDLATVPGMRAAVFGYNHSPAYVTLVLRVMEAYGDGDYTTVPDGVPSNQYVPPIPDRRGPEQPRPERGQRDHHQGDDSPAPGDLETPTAPTPPGGDVPPSDDAPAPGGQPRTDQPRDEDPTTPPGPGPSEPTPTDPTRDVTDTVTDTTDEVTDTVTDTTDDVTDTVTDTLTKAEATQQCLAQGISALDTAALAACVDDLLNG